MARSISARSKKGSAIAEASSAFSLLVPLAIIVLLAVIESTIAYIIHSSLTQAALEAAHDLGALWVAQNQPGQALTTTQQQAVFNNIVIPNVIPVNSSGNTNPNFTTAQFNFTSSPQTVTVTAMFVPGVGSYSYPWNVLNVAFATFFLPTNLTIRSTCTYPLPSRNATGA
jgi:hypothetical protein